MITLKSAREHAARILTVRAQIAALKAEEESLADTLRAALDPAAWGPVSVSDTQTVYVTAASERSNPAATLANVTDLARRLGATDAQITACDVKSPVRPSVRDRKRQASDR